MTYNFASELPILKELANAYAATFEYVLVKNVLRLVSINAFKDRYCIQQDRNNSDNSVL